MDTDQSASSISAVSLIKWGAMTHAFNMGLQFVPLTFTQTDSNRSSVTTPANSNIAPPGYDMLFVIDQQGVPSKAKMVKIS